jgi:Icc-related predicted phosphoesterase
VGVQDDLVTGENGRLKVAAVGDLHVSRFGRGSYTRLFSEVSENADVLLLAGDLTETGTVEEAEALAEDLRSCSITKLGVLGNHDYDSGQPAEVREVLEQAGLVLLDGDAHSMDGVGFAGVKGFAGGFRNRMLTAFGEEAIKLFVQEADSEARKLEHSLAQIHSQRKVVVLHYSPVPETVQGEPPEIFPFLGSSRLEHIIDDNEVSVVFHGHAHFGTPEGRTSKGISVYNVALPLMQRVSPDHPYRIIEF